MRFVDLENLRGAIIAGIYFGILHKFPYFLQYIFQQFERCRVNFAGIILVRGQILQEQVNFPIEMA